MVPIVRYMILCNDWHTHGQTGLQVTVVGLLWTIPPPDDLICPVTYREFCVFLALTGVRGRGETWIACVAEDSGVKVFETPKRIIPPRPDPPRSGRGALPNSQQRLPPAGTLRGPVLV